MTITMMKNAELEANRTRQHAWNCAQRVVAESATDRALRADLLRDARAALAARGVALPPEITVQCIDAHGPVLVLPDFLEEMQELEHDELVGVNGGEGSTLISAITGTTSTTAICGLSFGVVISVAVTTQMWGHD